MHPVLEVGWVLPKRWMHVWDVVVVFECASVCCCGPGVVSVISAVQVLMRGEC